MLLSNGKYSFLALLLVTGCHAGSLFAQGTTSAREPGFQAGVQLVLDIPLAVPEAGCTPVTARAATRREALQQTFIDQFDALDLDEPRWTPHYDGGYEESTGQWLGYDWRVKRTAPGLKEQEIYVDPWYKGSGKRALRLNPFSIKDGVLSITAQKTPEALRPWLYDFPYTSGILTSRRSFVQHQGYFEMRAKVPAGDALVPAFWLLPLDKSWPPEIDIMEAPGSEPDKIVTTVHWRDKAGKRQSSGCRSVVKDFAQGFHLYGALWTPERIVYYIDRKPVAQIATPPGLDLPMYMIVNLAVGGIWAGMVTPRTPIPSIFEIDWITAYARKGVAACKVQGNGVTSCEDQW